MQNKMSKTCHNSTKHPMEKYGIKNYNYYSSFFDEGRSLIEKIIFISKIININYFQYL